MIKKNLYAEINHTNGIDETLYTFRVFNTCIMLTSTLVYALL